MAPRAGLLLFTPPAEPPGSATIQQEAFLKHAAHLGLVIVTNRVVTPSAYGIGERQKHFAPEDFLAAIHDQPGVDAWVSLAGFPVLAPSHLEVLRPARKPFFVVTNTKNELRECLRNQVTDFVILPRFNFPAPAGHGIFDDQTWFHRYFQIIHAEEDLPPDLPEPDAEDRRAGRRLRGAVESGDDPDH